MIARLSDADDIEAWQEFVEIYLPLLYRLAHSKGLQHADAEELGQEVLIAVSRAVHRWRPDPARGRFRDWLFRIARNLIVNFLIRPKHGRIGMRSIDVDLLLEDRMDMPEKDTALLDVEYRREVFRWAADKVRPTVAATTWTAFWQSSVETVPIATVARELGMSVGSVYIARSRVMAKLRQAAKLFEHHHGPGRSASAPEYSQ